MGLAPPAAGGGRERRGRDNGVRNAAGRSAQDAVRAGDARNARGRLQPLFLLQEGHGGHCVVRAGDEDDEQHTRGWSGARHMLRAPRLFIRAPRRRTRRQFGRGGRRVHRNGAEEEEEEGTAVVDGGVRVLLQRQDTHRRHRRLLPPVHLRRRNEPAGLRGLLRQTWHHDRE